MNNVYLASVGTRSGKSILSIGLAMNYPGKVGFYKPFRENLINRNGNMTDQDAVLLAEVLKLEEGEKLSPFIYDIFKPVSLNEIIAKYTELSKNKEFMIIEGSRDLSNGFSHGISNFDIAQALGAPTVLVSSPNHQSIDSIFMFRHMCDERGMEFKGVVINRGAGPKEKEFLEKNGIRVLGEIPNIPELRAFHVCDIAEKLNAKAITGAAGMDRTVEEVIVGAMDPRDAVRYMQRSRKKAVITGGDRTDILLAALSTDTSCIIVSGGITPSRTVVSRADELGIPIILTDEDALTSAETIDRLIARIDPNDTKKIDLIKAAVKKNVDLDEIW